MSDTAHTFGTRTATQSESAMQRTYEGTRDTVLEGAHRTKDALVEGHQAVKKFTEESPHTAALMYAGLGFVLGMAVGMGMSRSTSTPRWYY